MVPFTHQIFCFWIVDVAQEEMAEIVNVPVISGIYAQYGILDQVT